MKKLLLLIGLVVLLSPHVHGENFNNDKHYKIGKVNRIENQHVIIRTYADIRSSWQMMVNGNTLYIAPYYNADYAKKNFNTNWEYKGPYKEIALKNWNSTLNSELSKKYKEGDIVYCIRKERLCTWYKVLIDKVKKDETPVVEAKKKVEDKKLTIDPSENTMKSINMTEWELSCYDFHAAHPEGFRRFLNYSSILRTLELKYRLKKNIFEESLMEVSILKKGASYSPFILSRDYEDRELRFCRNAEVSDDIMIIQTEPIQFFQIDCSVNGLLLDYELHELFKRSSSFFIPYDTDPSYRVGPEIKEFLNEIYYNNYKTRNGFYCTKHFYIRFVVDKHYLEEKTDTLKILSETIRGEDKTLTIEPFSKPEF